MTLLELAKKLRPIIEQAAQSLDDETAAEAAALFPAWGSGNAYAAGTRVQYGGGVYTVLQAHTSQQDWAPDAAPSLFAQLLPGQGGSGIGEWVQPDSTNPYMQGDTVTYGGKTWVSDIDNNVWQPGVYGWREVA